MNLKTLGLGAAALFIGLFVLLVIVIFWGMGINNDLVSRQEAVKSQWAQVETVLQRRFDLIPNLVNTVKGFAAQERGILEEVTRLRSQWGAANSIPEKAATAGQLEGALSRLLVVAERYPDLKSDQNFRDLQHELAGTENRIAVERQRYNEAVRDYNTRVRQFPASMIAAFRGFETDNAYFEAEQTAEKAPVVDFGTEK